MYDLFLCLNTYHQSIDVTCVVFIRHWKGVAKVCDVERLDHSSPTFCLADLLNVCGVWNRIGEFVAKRVIWYTHTHTHTHTHDARDPSGSCVCIYTSSRCKISSRPRPRS